MRARIFERRYRPPEQSGDESFWLVESDIQLYHFAAGEGKNVLIVHGGPGAPNIEVWPGLEPLVGEYRFHYYDQRGCGQSTRPIDTFSSASYYQNVTTLDQTLGLGAQLADIERIRRILGEEKLILIGHSFGGFMASLYAAEFPERVEALILIAPADLLVMPQEEGGHFEEIRVKLPEEMQAEYDAFIKEYLGFQNIFSKSEADLVALSQEFGRYYQTAISTDLPQQGEPGGWMVWAMYFSMGAQHDYRDALQQVNTPVLVIHGADDLQSEKVARTYADAFPNATFHVIEGSGHFPFYQRPDEFARVVGEFLSKVQ